MARELTHKVAAITGAASGIGLECAKTFLNAGARVVLIDYAADKLAEICTSLGPDAVPLVVNLTDPANVNAMMPRLLEKTGQLDIFHANAGSYVGGEVLGGDPDAWDRMLNLNVNAVFRCIHAVLPHMVERKSGDIIVTRCLATGETSKKDVLASYGSTAHRFLSIEQNDSGGPCGSFGEAKSLGHRRVESVRAKLYGACGFGGDPSCSSRDISLYLSWTRHGMAYLAASHDERLKKLVSFARGLRHLG